MALLGIHHVNVRVPDVEAAVAFYESLGMEKRSDRPDSVGEGAWLDAGGQQLHLSKGDPVDGKGQHFALELDDLDDVCARLRSRGLDVGDPRSLGPTLGRQTIVRDPAGNPVELREPPPN